MVGKIVLVSFGSYLNLPGDIVQKLCQAFKMVPLQFLWKLSEDTPCDVHNVKTMPWFPQNDILAHPHVKVFITHGGYNSIIESIYHGKAMVVFPIYFDQPFNSEIIQRRQLGVSMKIWNFTTYDLKENLLKVIKSQNISYNIQVASKILKKKPQSPGKRISFWINHVKKYGSRHLRTSAFKLSTYQYLLIDIFIIFVFILLLLLIVVFIILRMVFKFVATLMIR